MRVEGGLNGRRAVVCVMMHGGGWLVCSSASSNSVRSMHLPPCLQALQPAQQSCPCSQTHSPPLPAPPQVFTVEMHHKRVDKAGPGDNVGMNIKGLDKVRLREGLVGGQGSEITRSAACKLCCAACLPGIPAVCTPTAAVAPLLTHHPHPRPSLDPQGNMPRTGDVMILKSDATLKQASITGWLCRALWAVGSCSAGMLWDSLVACVPCTHHLSHTHSNLPHPTHPPCR